MELIRAAFSSKEDLAQYSDITVFNKDENIANLCMREENGDLIDVSLDLKINHGQNNTHGLFVTTTIHTSENAIFDNITFSDCQPFCKDISKMTSTILFSHLTEYARNIYMDIF